MAGNGSKLFPIERDESGNVITKRGPYVPAANIPVESDVVIKTERNRDEIIAKAKELNSISRESVSVARAIRKNDKKSKGTKAAESDHKARTEGPQERKTFSTKDLKEIYPKTEHQKDVFVAWDDFDHVGIAGSAGTGKTFVALYLALRDVLDADFEQKRIVIVRSGVPSRDLGFLPGSEEEKMAVYETPYAAILDELFPWQHAYENMKKAGLIQFATTSYLRGLTLRDSIVIADECQNMTFAEINTLVTRLGKNSRLFILGDYAQNDLVYKKNDQSGWKDFLQIVSAGYLPSMEMVHFDERDIVRSGFVKEWIIACNKAFGNQKPIDHN